MNRLFHFLKIAWAYWYFLIFTLIFFLFYPAFALLLTREEWYAAANKLRVLWARLLFLFTGVIPKIIYETELDRHRNYIFCSNHFSYLDIPMSALVVKRNWRFMAKMELGNIPIFNIFFRTVDISVDRENARESFKAVQEASESLDKKMNIVIYPEGTIGPNPPQLIRFKNGPFRLAIEKQIPIVPLTMTDNWKILFVNGWKIYGRPGIARVFVHEPIETTGLTISDLNSLKQKVFQIMESDLNKHTTQITHTYV